jgi:hypothetical protein
VTLDHRAAKVFKVTLERLAHRDLLDLLELLELLVLKETLVTTVPLVLQDLLAQLVPTELLVSMVQLAPLDQRVHKGLKDLRAFRET